MGVQVPPSYSSANSGCPNSPQGGGNDWTPIVFPNDGCPNSPDSSAVAYPSGGCPGFPPGSTQQIVGVQVLGRGEGICSSHDAEIDSMSEEYGWAVA